MRLLSLYLFIAFSLFWVDAKPAVTKILPTFDSVLTLQDIVRKSPQRVPGDLSSYLPNETKFLSKSISKSDQNTLDSPHEENMYDTDPEHGGVAIYTEYTDDNRKVEKILARRTDEYYPPTFTGSPSLSTMEMALEELKKTKPEEYEETVQETLADLGSEFMEIVMAYMKREIHDAVKTQIKSHAQTRGGSSLTYPYSMLSGLAYNPYQIQSTKYQGTNY